ncbi:asparagine synthase (glutamine-hydrolysing) [Microterricola viridarii]|uniref:asparagine synthase (glutamine-hydrolyzing) n=1 Tax=Microterricola viridarii TaxID=412690 RepID=A0A1H1P8U9_9MICO|nr:asparagine synthase (glutamine-hydrolysing) [Microterricola viridarii]
MRQFESTGVSTDVLRAMAAALQHRGPDDSGTWSEGGVGFAHTRLSIIDLAASRQPMESVDGRWVLVFNGEIFNYRQLREELDYPFHTNGDTETILAGVSIHGLDFVNELVGQFALALFDRATGSVHLVRDRLGVLPLYYSLKPDSLVFGSEVKALLAASPNRPDVDLASLDAYLSARSVASPHTLFAGVSKLPPGHRAEFSADGSVVLTRYWQLPPPDDDGAWNEQRVVDEVDRAVTSAVESALVADVPVGSYLSGGIDSSLIVAKAAALRPGRTLHTFAAGFGDPRHDELGWARRVSEIVGSEHHAVQVDAEDFERLWPKLTWHRDAPMSEPADIAVFRLAEAARQHVRVVLSGEGGDELFAGYPKYRAAAVMSAAARLPAGVRAGAAGLVERRLPERYARQRIALRVWGARTPSEQYRTWFAPFTASERRALLAGLPGRPLGGEGVGRDPIREMLVHDLGSWLPDNLLERGDRMSMAASLELRPPLLDHRLVELAFRIPSSYKVRDGNTKWALKAVARRSLPSEIVDRRKVGFRVPLDSWFRSGLRDSMWDRLTGTDSFVAQTLDRQAIRSLLERHESGKFDESSRIWTLMSLEVWHETFFRVPQTTRVD